MAIKGKAKPAPPPVEPRPVIEVELTELARSASRMPHTMRNLDWHAAHAHIDGLLVKWQRSS